MKETKKTCCVVEGATVGHFHCKKKLYNVCFVLRLKFKNMLQLFSFRDRVARRYYANGLGDLLFAAQPGVDLSRPDSKNIR